MQLFGALLCKMHVRVCENSWTLLASRRVSVFGQTHVQIASFNIVFNLL